MKRRPPRSALQILKYMEKQSEALDRGVPPAQIAYRMRRYANRQRLARIAHKED